MVFTGAQITSFFEDAAQMGLSNRTRLYIQGEGINHPDDLQEFTDKDAWDQIIENCKRPPQITNAAGALVNQQPFIFPAKSLMRLKIASKVVDYYARTSRPLSAANMMWVRLNNFNVEWKVIQDRKKANDELKLPVISKQLTVVAFFEAYESYASEFIGAANCPLSWIYREEEAVAATPPPQETDQPYSIEHKSVAGEMVHRFSHRQCDRLFAACHSHSWDAVLIHNCPIQALQERAWGVAGSEGPVCWSCVLGPGGSNNE